MDPVTLVCPDANLEPWLEALEAEADGPVAHDGPRDNWTSARAATATGQVRFTTLVEDRDEKHRRVSLGLYNWCRMVEDAPAEVTAPLASAVLNAPLLVGVVFDLDADNADDAIRMVLRVAERVRALVFNGSVLFDPDCRLLLNDEGESQAELSPADSRRFAANR